MKTCGLANTEGDAGVGDVGDPAPRDHEGQCARSGGFEPLRSGHQRAWCLPPHDVMTHRRQTSLRQHGDPGVGPSTDEPVAGSIGDAGEYSSSAGRRPWCGARARVARPCAVTANTVSTPVSTPASLDTPASVTAAAGATARHSSTGASSRRGAVAERIETARRSGPLTHCAQRALPRGIVKTCGIGVPCGVGGWSPGSFDQFAVLESGATRGRARRGGGRRLRGSDWPVLAWPADPWRSATCGSRADQSLSRWA